jgi:uncharacterized protein (TIGR00106 family)
MIVAEFRVIPVGAGSSMEEPIERALDAIREKGIRHKVGAMGTVLEAERLEDILDAVAAAHRAVRDAAPRIVTEITIDDRLDAPESAEHMVSEVARGRPMW